MLGRAPGCAFSTLEKSLWSAPSMSLVSATLLMASQSESNRGLRHRQFLLTSTGTSKSKQSGAAGDKRSEMLLDKTAHGTSPDFCSLFSKQGGKVCDFRGTGQPSTRWTHPCGLGPLPELHNAICFIQLEPHTPSRKNQTADTSRWLCRN